MTVQHKSPVCHPLHTHILLMMPPPIVSAQEQPNGEPKEYWYDERSDSFKDPRAWEDAPPRSRESHSPDALHGLEASASSSPVMT